MKLTKIAKHVLAQLNENIGENYEGLELTSECCQILLENDADLLPQESPRQ